MRFPHSLRCLLATLSLIALAAAPADEPKLALKENDVWVMAGDSITAQKLHTNFIEAYYRTRFPNLNLRFRNSGIGGNRTSHVLARFDYDIAAWKPTIVSVELGMNDVNGGDDPAVYIKEMREIIAKIRALPAQPVLISSSPVDDGSRMDAWTSQRCQRLHPYTEALQKLAAEEKVVFVDQYHPLIDLWGDNRAAGAAEAAKKSAPAPAPAPASTPDAKAKPTPPPLPPALIPIGGNPVHPGPVGQYNMATAILAGLGAPREVSSATLKADGKIVTTSHCKITNASAKDGRLSFTRLDEAGPWPILPAAKDAARLLPSMLDLSRYMLQVTGLPEGRYRVSIDGKPAAAIDSKELAAGWNITSAFDGAIGERATNILGAIGELEGKLNTDWRAASKAKDAEKLAAAQKAVDNADAKISAACTPAALHFEIELERFEREIAAFEAADKMNPPPQGAILFTGASGIKRWTTLTEDFPGLKVINRGFGGSQISDSIYFLDRVSIPYHPKTIVLQAGGNDINAHKPVAQVVADFKTYVEQVRAKLPAVKIVYLGQGPSPARWEQRDQQKELNKLISEYIAAGKNMAFVDLWDVTLGPDGLPRPELFVADKLHPSPEGYKLRTKILRPVIE